MLVQKKNYLSTVTFRTGICPNCQMPISDIVSKHKCYFCNTELEWGDRKEDLVQRRNELEQRIENSRNTDTDALAELDEVEKMLEKLYGKEVK